MKALDGPLAGNDYSSIPEGINEIRLQYQEDISTPKEKNKYKISIVTYARTEDGWVYVKTEDGWITKKG